jgi:AraC-like DNA-binding protein
MLTYIRPSLALLPYVDGYIYVRDPTGQHRGQPIRTTPRPGGVLTVNLGRPNQTADGATTPILSLLGIQTGARGWRSDANAHFVMVLLTPAGLAWFAPGAGRETADALLDLNPVIGVTAANALLGAAAAQPDRPAEALDHWLLARLSGGDEKSEMCLVRAACTILSQARQVDAAADRLSISRRHLSRIVSRNLGVSPKSLMDLHRLDRSVRALQAGSTEGFDGFADQAHAIREWRRRLDTTPGHYARKGCSPLAKALDPLGFRAAFYL